MQEKKLHQPKKDVGYPRPYLREGVPGLPLERQREMMRTAGIDVTDDRMLYVDKLTKAAVKARAPGSLLEREQALKPHRPGEAVYIAGLRVLGWSMSDIARALAQAWRREAVVYCLDTDKVFTPDIPVPDLLEELASAEDADRRARDTEKQSRATDAATKARKREKLRKLAIARPMWGDRSFSDAQIEAASGYKRRTLYIELGPRFEKKGVPHV